MPTIVAAAVVVDNGRVLLTKRAEGQHLAGLWEFPGGKLDSGESPEEALVRECREECGI
ncbi:MAG: NUDIX domain-containing protein, partial [Deltaproteobacteria bacterium]|nr:NUDIX domain-containing protein [Deltaproteobacteria bacterium]